MSTVSFFTPDLAEIQNPSEEMLRNLFLDVDLTYWRNGECDVAFRAFDDDGAVTSELYVELRPPNQFHVKMNQDDGQDLVVSSFPGNHEMVKVYDGQQYRYLPLSHLCSGEAAFNACYAFCRTFGQRDPKDFWIRSDPLDPAERPEDREDYDWNDERVM